MPTMIRHVRKKSKTAAGERYMSTQVHNTAEIGKILLWVAGIVVFIVVALTWVPDWIAPQGGVGGSDTGKTVKMIK
jgi:hypothetical protein